MRVAEDVNVALGPGVAGRDVEQIDPGVGGDVPGPTFRHLGVVGLVEQGGNPELEVEAGGHEYIGLR